MEPTKHVPVMMQEAISGLELRTGMVVIDATLGGGGYTRAIADCVGVSGRVIACDADQEAIDRFQYSYGEAYPHVELVHTNYAHIKKVMQLRGIDHVDAIVADLGLSSDQIANDDAGFSFTSSGSLDMRLNRVGEGETAATYLDSRTHGELARDIALYGDEKYAGKAAAAIIDHRSFTSTQELSQCLEDALSGVYRNEKIHPATRTVQAIRIAVNREYENLEIFLVDGISMLNPGCFMSVVTFHSGEDRIVKHIFREHARDCVCDERAPICVCSGISDVDLHSKKPLLPDAAEVAVNPRSRSAKLRIVQKNS